MGRLGVKDGVFVMSVIELVQEPTVCGGALVLMLECMADDEEVN